MFPPLQSLWTEEQEASLSGIGYATSTQDRGPRARRRRLVSDYYARAIDVFRREALPNELMTWQDSIPIWDAKATIPILIILSF